MCSNFGLSVAARMHIMHAIMHDIVSKNVHTCFPFYRAPLLSQSFMQSNIERLECAPCDPRSVFNWSECMICQKPPKDDLKCPSDGHIQPAPDVYRQFADRFQNMTEMSAEPPKQHLKLQHIFQKHTIDEVTAQMILNKGKWHKGCSLQYNSLNLNRLTKRTFKQDVNSTDAELATTRHQGP